MEILYTWHNREKEQGKNLHNIEEATHEDELLGVFWFVQNSVEMIVI